jgi:outer membrane immunogenic protein
VRGRIGYVWGNGNVLSYVVTGGLAYGKVDLEGTGTVGAVLFFGPSGQPPLSVTQAFGHSQVNTGWVLGYGTEGRLALANWTWKIEGLYMDLGHLDATGPGAFQQGTSFATPSLTAGSVTTHTHFTDGILRTGLNYKFY